MTNLASLLILVLLSDVHSSLGSSADWTYWGPHANRPSRIDATSISFEDSSIFLIERDRTRPEISKLKYSVIFSQILSRSRSYEDEKKKSFSKAYCLDTGPDFWPGVCTEGKKQSPINIMSDDALKTDLGALKFIRYDYAYTASVTNTGHSVQVSLTGIPMFLKGGGLTSTYIFDQMHFHWGSEHTIDGTRDALELHMVHYAEQYHNFSAASQKDYGLAVIAVLFKISDEDNQDMWSILEATERVSEWVGPSSTLIQRRVIPSLLLPKDYTTFYRYDGSLTTPGCYETVTWFVLTEKLAVSHAQMNVFENVKTNNGTLKMNYRPVQKLGSRDIYHSLVDYSGASISTTSQNCLIAFAVVVSSLLFVP